MEVVRSHPHRERRVERVVFGGTLWSQNSLLLHNEQDLSIAIPYRPQQVDSPSPKACRPKQVHSTFRGASTSPWFFGWTICSSLSSSSLGGWTACSADSLVQNPWFRHWHRKPSRITATGLLIHSSCPIAMDSWTFEIHWTWSELHWFVRYRACFLLEGEKVLGDFPGLCKILHETTLLGCPSCIPVFFSLLL